MEKVKILSVGIGGFANGYLTELFKNYGNGFDIVGAVEPYPKSCRCLEEFEKRQIPIYPDMDSFYKEHKADLAIITTPIFLHTAQTLTALRNGSNVMCEKPLSGVSSDGELIENEANRLGRFVMTGYQWSYSDAILELKRDVLSGRLGAPLMMKTMILWPRNTDYFSRGSGWAGKIKLEDGTVVNDSVAANATAHYLHNMLFVTGKEYMSSEATDIKAELIRTNNIENYDTACVSFNIGAAKCLFIASHSTLKAVNPVFEYRFEKGTVSYEDSKKDIVAVFNDGSTKNYGCPATDVYTKKIYEAIRGCGIEGYRPVCSPLTATPHVKWVEEVQKAVIRTPKAETVKQRDNYFYIEGLGELLEKCYSEEKLPSEYKEYGDMLK